MAQYSDGFTYADGALSGQSSWEMTSVTNHGASPVVSSNAAIAAGRGLIRVTTAAAEFGGTWQEAQLVVNDWTLDAQIRPAVLVSDSGGYIVFKRGADGGLYNLEIRKVASDGTTTSPASEAGITVSNGDVIKLRAEIDTPSAGTVTLRAYVNGTEEATGTDSSSPFTTGQPGIYVVGEGGSADDFVAADSNGAAATPTISSVTPSTVTPSSNLAIVGTNLGDGTGPSAVTISPADDVEDAGAVTATVGSGDWADELVETTGTPFPTGTAHNDTLYLFVTNDSGETNAAGYVLTASVAPALSNDGVADATTDGFKLTWDTDTDSGTSAWALFATAEHRNAWTVSGLPGALTEPANSVAWGTQAVTALGTQETALITGLGGGQTLYYRIYHYGDVTANGS